MYRVQTAQTQRLGNTDGAGSIRTQQRKRLVYLYFLGVFLYICSSLVRIKFESASEKVPFLRTKLEFDCHLIQLKPLFVFFKTPYKVLGVIRSKYLAFILQVKCKQTFITLSFDFPLTFL